MKSLIRASLSNPYAVAVAVFSLVILGSFALLQLPVDILPAYRSPAVQVLTFYGGMSATNVEKDLTSRLERWTGQAAGTIRQESRSIVGASVVRNYYSADTDLSGALTQVASLATAATPSLPPGTLPPVILPFDPTGTTPVCILALDSDTRDEAQLYDAGRFEVRNMVMSLQGAVAPVVYGGKNRAIIAYLNREQLQARQMSPVDVMEGLERYNIFLPTGTVKFGVRDYALESNSMYDLIEDMRHLPLKMGTGRPVVLGDVATPRDTSLMQTTVVRVNGRKQVYIPIYRQAGSSTLRVVDQVRENVPDIQSRLTFPDIGLKLVMDQSVYVRHAISSLTEEGVLGAVLCSLVILVFLGEWRMTVIAVLTIPIAVLGAMFFLWSLGQTINVMTLAGLALAIGPLVDCAIISLENTHRHLSLGKSPRQAAYFGAGEVVMPGLVATCCTLLVLAPLAFVPGLGGFLFKPLGIAVTFSMVCAFLLSVTLVPVLCALMLSRHGHDPQGQGGLGLHVSPATTSSSIPTLGLSWLFAWLHGIGSWVFRGIEANLEAGFSWYGRVLEALLRRRLTVLAVAVLAFVVAVPGLGSRLRREFFPEVDSGAFEISVRGLTGTRLEVTVDRIADVELAIREVVGDDLELIISESGVTPDWSAAYTQNAGPMDSVIKVQLKAHRKHSAQLHIKRLRGYLSSDRTFTGLEFSFEAGGMIRGAMNEGKSTPINVQIVSKDLKAARKVAERIQADLMEVRGVVDCRIVQRLDYPQYLIDVDKTKAATLGLTQAEIMRNVVAAFNSSIQFNKRNFWIDPVTSNQYYVGVQYPEQDIKSLETMLQVPITGAAQRQPIPLGNIVTLRRSDPVPAEIVHTNLRATIDLTMNVSGRDLGHVAEDVAQALAGHGVPQDDGSWAPFDPSREDGTLLKASRIRLLGEYARMQEVFRFLGVGLLMASVLVYFLMAPLFRSWVVPLVIMSAAPLGLVGVVLVLLVTKTSLNVQSLLGVIFMVAIVVSNTVLMIDFAQGLRRREGLTPTEAIQKAARIRVRPVLMTALAAFFALLPMAIGAAHGSEANAPLGRSVLGGLVAGVLTTLLVVPCLYSLLLPNAPGMPPTGDQVDPIVDE